MSHFQAADLEAFRELVVRRMGLQLDHSKRDLLAEVFERRLADNGQAAAHYLARVAGPAAPRDELRRIAEALTVPETYFFRHREQFQALTEVAIPVRQAARATTQHLRILSAGCASGEEAYSLAISTGPEVLPGWEVTVEGVDINCAMLARAARGRYSSWSLRDTSEDLQARWFTKDGRDVVLDPAVRARVHFLEHNLALPEGEADPWLPAIYDVIFCRNVIMYFTPERARRVVARLARALAPGGYLFLGSAESLRGVSNDFELCHSHGAFYYQRKSKSAWVGPSTPTPPTGATVPLADDWQAEVQRSHDRIEALRDRGTRWEIDNSASAVVPAPLLPFDEEGAPTPEIARALACLRDERYGDALVILQGLTAGQRRVGSIALLHAVLLVHAGDLVTASSVAAELIARNDHAADAHHALGLCYEAQGDRTRAMEENLVAVRLDPAFALARLHLGLLARRRGDVDGAQRELRQAHGLLNDETPARILLFGGGFAREGLRSLCERELSRLEEIVGLS